jgi:hypothetical protein
MSLMKSIEALLLAIDKLAKGDVPFWMNPIEKKAYALGIIDDDDIVTHDQCQGTTWLFNEEDGTKLACSCMSAKGKAISIPAKRTIKSLFPNYDFIDTPPHLDPNPEDDPERAQFRARVREECAERRRKGDYEAAEHIMSQVFD